MQIHREVDRMIDRCDQKIRRLYSLRRDSIEKAIAAYLDTVAAEDRKLFNAFAAGDLSERDFKNKRLNNIVLRKEYNPFLDTVAGDIAGLYEEGLDLVSDNMNDAAQLAYRKELEPFDIAKAGAAALAVGRIVKDREKQMQYVRRGVHSNVFTFASSTAPFPQMKERLTVEAAQRSLQRSYKTVKRNLVTWSTYAENKGRQSCYDVLRAVGVERSKVWITCGDDRVRDSHADADGQTVPTDEPFIVGGCHMMFPGDSSAPADEIMNCRCWMELAK